MTGPEYINITADEMETLTRLTKAGKINGGTVGFSNAHLDKLSEEGMIKSLGANQYLCAAKGQHLVMDYRANPEGFTFIASAKPDLKAPPKKAERRRRKKA